MKKLYIHKGTPLVEKQINDKVTGFFPVEYTELKDEPKAKVNIGKISLSLWRTINFFFKTVAKKENSEAQVRLFYSDVDNQWKAHAFPQKANTGMTTKELCDSPGFQEQMNEVIENGKYYQYGTIHSHVYASAFQSGTDKNDEAGCPGVHITIGKLDQANIDIAQRFTVIVPGVISQDEQGNEIVVSKAKKFFMPVDMQNFVSVPEDIYGSTNSEELKKIIFNFVVSENSEELVDHELVNGWMKNRIEEEKVVTKTSFLKDDDYDYSNFHSKQLMMFDSLNKSYKKSSKKNNRHKVQDCIPNSSTYRIGDRQDLERLVNKICLLHKVSQAELSEILLSRPEQVMSESYINLFNDIDINILSVYKMYGYSLGLEIQDWVQERMAEATQKHKTSQILQVL
jgi:hypothetical protein